MSQNKTIVPGFSPVDDGLENDMYHQSSNVPQSKRTFVPDVYREASLEIENELRPKAQRTITFQDRKIVGFLYSVSHIGNGEFFPVYIGKNLIGTDEDCDIRLAEETVSLHHAVLLVRQTLDLEGNVTMTATLSDYGSEYGTSIGNYSLEYEKKECFNNDIIAIGNHYKLALFLINTDALGLSFEKDFHELQCGAGGIGIDDMSNSDQVVIQNVSEEMELSFYNPSRAASGDHSTNKTVMLQ